MFKPIIGKYWTKSYKQINLIPGIIIGFADWIDVKEYRITIDWLCFYIEFNLRIGEKNAKRENIANSDDNN